MIHQENVGDFHTTNLLSAHMLILVQRVSGVINDRVEEGAGEIEGA